MARQKEAQFRQKAMSALRSIPGSFWLRIEQQSIRGTPDCVGLIRGYFVAIEFKSTPRAKVTELQMFNLQNIAECGGISVIANPINFPECLQMLTHFAETGQMEIISRKDISFN